MTERVNITLPESLLAQIDEAAASEHTTRSGYIRAAVLARMRESAPAQHAVAEEARAPYTTSASAESPATLGPPALPVVLNRLRAFCAARDDIRIALVFGSAALGTADPLSDVDVAVLLPDEWDTRRRSQVQGELMDRLPAALGTPQVDVVVLNDASPALAYHATWDGVVAWGSGDPVLTDVKVRALKEYLDFRPVMREMGRALRERIEDGSFGK